MPTSTAWRQNAATAPAQPEVLRDHPQASNDALLGAPAPLQRITLWDLPLRIFHWSLLAAVSTAIATGLLGGEWMGVHGKAGLTIAGLISFRVVWGVVGSTHARFASFAPGPKRLLSYLQGRWQGVGHNPLGALSVFALLGLLAAQVSTGLVGNDDIAFTGPLVSLVSESVSSSLTAWHHRLATVLYVLLGLHVAAIAFYSLVKKQKLVKPMVTGWKDVPASVKPPRKARPVALLLSVAIALGAVYLANGSWLHQTPNTAPAPEAPRTASPANHGTQAAQAAPAW